MLVIGELINSSRPLVRDAMESRNAAVLLELAQRQKESGAHYVDVNCSALGPHESVCLSWLIPLLQDSLDVQISIDSANASVILDALSLAKGQPIINSVIADSPELSRVFAAARDREAKVIGLCLSGTSLPASPGQTRANAEKLLSKAADSSFPLHDLFLDPLVRDVRLCVVVPHGPGLARSHQVPVSGRAHSVRPEQHLLRHACQKVAEQGIPSAPGHTWAGRGHSRPDRQRTHGNTPCVEGTCGSGGGSA